MSTGSHSNRYQYQSVEVEQLKADLNRIVGKSQTHCAKLRESLGFDNFAQWIAIECHIRCYLDQLNQA